MLLLCLGPWNKAGIVCGSHGIYTSFSFGDLVQNFFCSYQSHFSDLGVCRVNQIWLILLDKLYNFQLDCSSDEVDNCASMISDTEFGLLGQLIELDKVVLNGFLALFQCKEGCLCVSNKSGRLEGFL